MMLARIGFCLTVFGLVFLMGWLALRGDDIRAHRMGLESVEELDKLDWEEVERRIEIQRRQQENECGWACVQRIEEGE